MVGAALSTDSASLQVGPFRREKTVRVVAYVRVSTAKQEEAYGPAVQRADIRQWAKTNGHKVIGWRTDVISGASELSHRVGWREVAELVRDGRAKGVVVARLDRLARDVMVQELLLRKLSAFGGVVWSTRASENEMLNNDGKDPARKLVRVILGAISEYDRVMTVDRLASARAAKAARGGYAHGAVPYGFRSQAGVLVPLAAEQAVLERMIALAARGESTRAIAALLNSEGVPAKRGGRWSPGTVARMVKRDNLEGVA